jgi:hypothetical protein
MNIIKNKFIDNIPLSFQCKQLILGSILGDGKLCILQNYNKACFFIRHSIIQEEYFYWKVSHLTEISTRQSLQIQNSSGFSKKIKLLFKSSANLELTSLYNFLYKKGKLKIERRWLNFLNPFGLLIWWLDDGSIIDAGRRGVICTDCFSKDHLLLVCRFFYVNFQIDCKIYPYNKKSNNKIYFRIYFSSLNLQKFLKLIAPHLETPSMIYKFKIVYVEDNLQQRWISDLSNLLKNDLLKESFFKMYEKSENDIVQ